MKKNPMGTFSEAAQKALKLFMVQIACRELSSAPYMLNFLPYIFYWPTGMGHESENEERIYEIL